MSKIGKWSTSAASNSSTPPDGWPEGMAPSSVNDAAREMMAQIKTYCNDAEWFDRDFTPSYVNANSFTVPGDQTTVLRTGRALKLYDGTTIVRSIGSASYTVVTTISLDSGVAITSSLSSFAVSSRSPAQDSEFRRPFMRATGGGYPVSVGAVTLSLATVTTDNYGWFASATGKYTPQIPGLYLCSGHIFTLANSATTRVQFTIGRNLTAETVNADFRDISSGANVLCTTTGIVKMNGSSDYIQASVVPTGGTVSLGPTCLLQVAYLGPA